MGNMYSTKLKTTFTQKQSTNLSAAQTTGIAQAKLGEQLQCRTNNGQTDRETTAPRVEPHG